MMTDELYDESGFFFRQRKGKLNLRKLEAIDLEKVIREVDVDLLQQCIENITFSEFQDYDIHYLTDKQIVKLFKLSQLTIEYLLFTQRKLVTNLTDLAKKYSLKKKSLYRKRKELAYLKEETTRLQIQLKTKRRNLQTLEKLIESANQDHDWFLQQQQKQLADKLGQKVPENRGLIKFFVGFPDGMFIELEESSEITIKYLISVINNLLFYERSAVGNNKNATVPGGVRKISSAEMDHPSLYDNNSQNIKLFLRGKLLMVNATLSQAGVITGDTLLATFAFPPTESKEPEIKQETKVDDQSAVTKSLVEALASQTNCIQRLAEEINGWKKVVSDTPKEVVAKDDGRLADHLDHRLKLMELEIRESLKALPRPEDLKPRLVFGELENDDEARFNPKFDALSSQMEQIGTAVRSMKSILEDQQVQVNELRRSLSERVAPVVPNIVIQNPLQPVINQQAPQPAPQPIIIEKEVHIAAAKPAAMKTVEKSIVRASSNRWNMLPYQTNEEVRAEPTTPAVVEVQKVEEIVFNPKKEPERKKPEVREEPKPVKKEVIETPKPVIKKADPATVLIVFPYQHNPLLKAAMMSATGAASGSFGPTDGVAIEMKSSLSDKDEIIAFIRTMIAMQVNTKMQNVYLTMENRTIKLAFDLPPSATFSPQEVVEYAGSGKLQVGIHGLRTVSNVQIDLLFPAFEKENPAPKSNDKNKSKNMAKVPLSAAGQGLTKQKSNRVNTDNKNEDVPELKAISQIRGSLQNLLEELDNVQSLSDVDLAKKRADLEAYSSTSEIEGLKDTRTSVIKSLGSMTLLGDDFPTEDYIEHKQRSLAMSKSGEGLTTKASAKDVGRDSLDEKENRRRKNPRESKSLRLSEKSYEDYKRMMESVESLPLTDSRMSADYQNAMRKSVQRRSYYEDDEFEGEDRSRASYGQPIMRGQRGGGGGGYYDEKSAASSRFDISSPMDYSNSFQHPRSLPVSSNRSNLMKPDFTTTLNSTNGDDTLVFSSEGNDTPFNMTNNSSLVSSMRPQEKFLNTQEIQRRADHFERQAERDLYGGEDDEDERGLQDDEDTLNMTNNTSNNSQNTRHNTTTDSPFKEFRRFNATGNTAGTTLTNNTFSTTGSSGRSRGRYRDEDEAGDMEEDDMEEKRREPFTPSALNEGIGRRAEGGRRRNPLDESLDEENDRYAAHNNNDTASVHSLALSDT